jgi:hypothetical protein
MVGRSKRRPVRTLARPGDGSSRYCPSGRTGWHGTGGRVHVQWWRLAADQCFDNPWDEAHALFGTGSAFAAAATGVEAVDLDQAWPWVEPQAPGRGFAAAGTTAEFCSFDPQKPDGGVEIGQ